MDRFKKIKQGGGIQIALSAVYSVMPCFFICIFKNLILYLRNERIKKTNKQILRQGYLS